MGQKIVEIKILPEKAEVIEEIELQLAHELNVKSLDGFQYKILRKSLDARKKPIHFIFRIEVFSQPDQPKVEPSFTFPSKQVGEAVIVGFGPAGMFAALELLTHGIKPIVIERGSSVKVRRRDLMEIYRRQHVNPESNYCFGEGGAGTFSDGKLYTRSKKRGDIQQILQCFVEHGAEERIMYEAHPHIGTNKLPSIVEQIRLTIEKAGGEVRFNTKLLDLEIENSQINAVITNHGSIATSSVILATGHSARDIFELLQHRKISIEAKPFALGVRIEHSQKSIDKIQYRCEDRGLFLPPSSYSLVHQVGGRGVFSFCMCPGGIIAPAMTGPNEMVVNGWSPSKRNGQFANSGFVVQVMPEDWEKYADKGALAALEYQKAIEKIAFDAAGGNLTAPAQRASDFIQKRVSKDLPACSYIPGVTSVDLHKVLPQEIAFRISEALKVFNKKMTGYGGYEALLVGVESRTSSPVRIPREKETLEHTELKGLYPCGEGAGYAGGIMSAALDGIACARAIALAKGLTANIPTSHPPDLHQK